MGRQKTSYDFIVVGAGTAGSVVAARLSENRDAQVLLLEAGPADGPAAVSVPREWFTLLGSEVDWDYQTVEQAGLASAALAYPRGKMLGGSSSINGMFFLRGDPSAYDDWAAGGAAGWGYEDLLPYFRRSETAEGRDRQYRGTDGPLRPSRATDVHPVAGAALEAFEQLGYPLAEDLNAADREGASRPELSVVNGVRQSAADAYLRPVLRRPNLTVITDASVRSLTLSGTRCTGVEYSFHGELLTAEAAGETILCAGAIGSPQLLQLSGIGPFDALRIHHIDVVVDLPGVGENLVDHPLGSVVYTLRKPVRAGSNNHGDAFAALRTDPALSAPNVQLLVVDIPFIRPPLAAPDEGFAIAFSALRPHSRGAVRLASNDPETAPLIDPALLTDERDMRTMLAALRLAREIGRGQALAAWRKAEVQPGHTVRTERQERDYLRRSTGTYHHPVGTCRLGTDEQAVTDLELRVRGVDGLRVADASVMPSIPGAGTNAAVFAIAERAAAIIAGHDRLPKSSVLGTSVGAGNTAHRAATKRSKRAAERRRVQAQDQRPNGERMFLRRFVVSIAATAAAFASAAVLAACGNGTSMTTPRTAAGTAATLGVAGNNSLGRILVDSHGRTLYLFLGDEGTTSNCLGPCAASWPPLRASRRPTVGTGLPASSIGTTRRSDGARQVTYHGHPLYRFAGDPRPGDTNGQGSTAFGGSWFALSPSGVTVAGIWSAPRSGMVGY